MKEVTYNGHTYKLGELWASSKNFGNRNAGRITGFSNGMPVIKMTEVVTTSDRVIGEEATLDNFLWEKIEEAPKEEIVFLVIDPTTNEFSEGDSLENAIKSFESENHDLDSDCVIYEAKVIKVKKETKYIVEGK